MLAVTASQPSKMSESDDDASVLGIEEALSRLNLSIRGYNKSRPGAREHQQPDDGSRQSESSQETCEEYARGIDWVTGEPLLSRGCDRDTDQYFPNTTDPELKRRLNALRELQSFLPEYPYSTELYSRLADAYADAGYPDLAAGVAYKALLLLDNIDDEDAEFYEPAFLALAETISKKSLLSRCGALSQHPDVQQSLFHPRHAQTDDEGRAIFPVTDEEVRIWANEKYARKVYVTLAQCLHDCGCERSAASYCATGLEKFPNDEALKTILEAIQASVTEHLNKSGGALDERVSIDQYPDEGMVRRECYPWNTFEPDRCSDEVVSVLNAEMQRVAPRLEVRATELPALAGEGTSTQLGVFAKEDIAPGDIVLEETSLLTACIHLLDPICDACSTDLPDMNDEAFSQIATCPDCEVVFCNQNCADLANEEYHPAVCDKGVEAIARNVPPTEAANTLYTLLLLRLLAMAETQESHPLDLKYVKYIWGDYHNANISDIWTKSQGKGSAYPRTLPFSFQANVVLPFNMLEMMDVDVFQSSQYDVWVFNTLYAKFRGTASARLSGLKGRPIRGPEVSAVHPNWCLANHSCDPNVTWNWSSQVKFRVREERVEWKVDNHKRSQAGLKKDEEVLSHYCDIDLPVDQRREWAAGSLGGNCCCERCMAESQTKA